MSGLRVRKSGVIPSCVDFPHIALMVLAYPTASFSPSPAPSLTQAVGADPIQDGGKIKRYANDDSLIQVYPTNVCCVSSSSHRYPKSTNFTHRSLHGPHHRTTRVWYIFHQRQNFGGHFHNIGRRWLCSHFDCCGIAATTDPEWE